MKVKAVERLLKFTKDENDPGVYRYVMKPEMYSSLNQAKVIREEVTLWLCPDWERCASDCVRRQWRRSRT